MSTNFDERDSAYGFEREYERAGMPGRAPRRMQRRKICRFCAERMPIDYKDVRLLGNFVTERGKLIPNRITGNCAKHQRELTTAVKRARNVALLPFSSSTV
jgi:small subunit ribosomal protein S18